MRSLGLSAFLVASLIMLVPMLLFLAYAASMFASALMSH